MKFLEDVYFSIKYMYSEFQWLACPFCFLITFCSHCGMKWDTAFGSILSFFIRLRRGFLPSQGPLILNILNSFSWSFSVWLANYVKLSFLVESPILYLAFFKTILAALFRAFGLPLSFLPSEPSFLHNHSTFEFFQFFSNFYNR